MNTGHAIGPYTIVAKLGEGGMGEVYRARDSKLKREVAIKVLPADVANDRERLARFQREAEVLASLNHPYIAHVYGIEENALVMELVEGEDLSQRIARGPIPIDEALPIAKQIAEALEAAHDAGIIHRDLKPANIKVRPDGTVKVLDFGLAKAMDRSEGDGFSRRPDDLANSPTITSPANTMRGVILGTAAYMAPEQAKGKAVDKRADIWAFGCVLYELLTGKRAFKGDDVTDIITSVMRDAPDWNALPPSTPPSIRTLLRRCLEKDPRQRAPHAAMARLEIDDAMTLLRQGYEGQASTSELMQSAPVKSRGLSYSAAAAIALVSMALAAGVTWMSRRPANAPQRPVIRTSFPLSDVSTFRTALQRKLLTISPNSRAIAILSNGLQIRQIDQLEWTAVPNTSDATSVFASADNQWIGYLTRTGIWKVPVAGGQPVQISQMGDTGSLGAEAAAWGDDDRIYFTDRTGLHVIPASGGARETISSAVDFGSIEVVPAGAGLLYSRGRAQDRPAISMHSFDGREDAPITEGLSPKFVAPDLMLFVRGGALMGAKIDLAGRRLLTEPVRLVDNVAVLSTSSQYDVSESGTLVYFPSGGGSDGHSTLTLRKPDGTTSRFLDIVRAYSDPRLSPDGKKIAFHLFDQDNDIWVLDISRSALTRITFDPNEDETPVWSPDGQWIAFAGYVRKGGQDRAVLRRRADGSGSEEMLWHSPNHSHVTDWSPNGKWIVIEVAHPERGSDIVLIDVEKRTARPLLETPFNESSARISPDGKWVVYLSEESGRAEVYVQSFPELGRKLLISTQGGGQPIWSRDGRTVYFRSETAFASARVDVSRGTFQAAAPTSLLADTFMRPQAVNHTTYEVFPDGSLLLLAQPEAAAGVRPSLIAVFNWLDEARAKISGK